MSGIVPGITMLHSDAGENLAVAGSQYRILVSGEATNGRYAVIEMNVPPGGGPPPHSHPEIEETFYVAAGEVTFKIEGSHFTASPGAFIHIPASGAVHAFKNLSNQYARLVCTVTPARLDSLFKEVSIAGPAHARAISEKYGHTVYAMDYLDEDLG